MVNSLCLLAANLPSSSFSSRLSAPGCAAPPPLWLSMDEQSGLEAWRLLELLSRLVASGVVSGPPAGQRRTRGGRGMSDEKQGRGQQVEVEQAVKQQPREGSQE